MEYLCILNGYEQSNRMKNVRNKPNTGCILWQPWRNFSRREESRLTTKELPTTKWRRDRRLRTSEYQHSISSSSSSSPPSSPLSGSGHHISNYTIAATTITTSTAVKLLTETTNTVTNNSIECPIDMSVTSTTIKPRSPPPPYREPLPGSTFATALARPSVITQAPKRDNNCMISNRENDNRNNSTESISMCDPVIDEHFRRSLGADYMNLFAKKTSSLLSPQLQQQQQQNNHNLQQSKFMLINPPVARTTPSPPSLIAAPSLPLSTSLSISSAASSISPLSSSSCLSPSSSASPSFSLSATPAAAAAAAAATATAAATTTTASITTTTTTTATVTITDNDSIGTSVDDHFAKALGDTWKKLQADQVLRNHKRRGGSSGGGSDGGDNN